MYEVCDDDLAETSLHSFFSERSATRSIIQDELEEAMARHRQQSGTMAQISSMFYRPPKSPANSRDKLSLSHLPKSPEGSIDSTGDLGIDIIDEECAGRSSSSSQVGRKGRPPVTTYSKELEQSTSTFTTVSCTSTETDSFYSPVASSARGQRAKRSGGRRPAAAPFSKVVRFSSAVNEAPGDWNDSALTLSLH